MNYSVKVLAEARKQLYSIKYYIAYILKNKSASSNFQNEVNNKLRNLKKEPHIYGYAPYSNKYRKIAIKNYVALFFIDEATKSVYITAIVYSGSDYSKYIYD